MTVVDRNSLDTSTAPGQQVRHTSNTRSSMLRFWTVETFDGLHCSSQDFMGTHNSLLSQSLSNNNKFSKFSQIPAQSYRHPRLTNNEQKDIEHRLGQILAPIGLIEISCMLIELIASCQSRSLSLQSMMHIVTRVCTTDEFAQLPALHHVSALERHIYLANDPTHPMCKIH